MSAILVVTAHPDDEIFMAGTIARMVKSQGREVFLASFADGVTSRGDKATVTVAERRTQQHAAAAALGCHVLSTPGYDDQQLDRVALHDMTRRVEAWIEDFQPEVVFTHSLADANEDHRIVAKAVRPAVRGKSGVREVYAFLVHPAGPFWPTAFWDVTNYLSIQIAAMGCYGNELVNEIPLIRARAEDYGYRCDVPYAEGFETIKVLR